MLGNIGQICLRVAAARCLSTSPIHNRRIRNRFTPTDDPGVHRRLKMIKEDEADIIEKSDIDLDDIEGLEEDFLHGEGMSDEVMSNMKRIKSAMDYKMIERKHFKPPKEPNMLTWSEKEQIRHLHETEPDRWTPITLAESFPVSPDTIKKIIRNKWKPLSKERLIQHDRKVSDNWVAFHKGKLEIHNHRLRIHLEKFTDRKEGVRTASIEEAKRVTEIVTHKPKRTEFLSLITSFRPVEEKTGIKEIEQNHPDEDQENRNLIGSPKSLTVMERSKANYTITQLRRRIKDEIKQLPDPSPELKAIIRERQHSTADKSGNCDYIAPSERFITDAVVYQRRKKSALQLHDLNDLPHKIQIPKEKWKRGQIYRVNDSFYTDNGYFLYRVPGLKT